MVYQMSRDLRDRLIAAVEKLGGSRRAARLSNIPRATIDYWMHIGIADKARSKAMQIIELARDETKHKQVTTPPWALTMLKQRQE
jgi:hypothetical protein